MAVYYLTMCDRNLIAGAALLISVSLFAGCDHTPRGSLPRGDVAITVTYDKQPVTDGRVSLNNYQTGEGGGADLSDQGVVTLMRVVAGSYVVTVTPPIFNIAPVEPGEAAPGVKIYKNLPQKFRQVATSPLHVDVKQGEAGEYRFDLKELEQAQPVSSHTHDAQPKGT